MDVVSVDGRPLGLGARSESVQSVMNFLEGVLNH